MNISLTWNLELVQILILTKSRVKTVIIINVIGLGLWLAVRKSSVSSPFILITVAITPFVHYWREYCSSRLTTSMSASLPSIASSTGHSF